MESPFGEIPEDTHRCPNTDYLEDPKGYLSLALDAAASYENGLDIVRHADSTGPKESLDPTAMGVLEVKKDSLARE